jgi:hypothetical protein
MDFLKIPAQYIQTVFVWGGGGVNCAVDHILQEFYALFLTNSEPTKLLHHPKQNDQ